MTSFKRLIVTFGVHLIFKIELSLVFVIFGPRYESFSRIFNFRLGQGEIKRMNNCKRGPHHRPTNE